MKLLPALILAFALACNAAADERPDPALAMQYLTASQTEAMINATLESYGRELFRNMTPEKQASYAQTMRQVMGWEAVRGELAAIVMELYTREELEAALAFMQTPLGASFTAKSAQLSDRMFAPRRAANHRSLQASCISTVRPAWAK